MDQLPMAFLPELQNHIRFDAEMIALDYTADSVTIHYRSPTGLEQVQGNFAILILPFPALRFVEVLTPFSPAKQMAIRQLHYLNIGKVLAGMGPFTSAELAAAVSNAGGRKPRGDR